MSVKKIYFVRHGQSEFNAQHLAQGPEGNLSEKGQAQAETIGKRFENIPVDAVIVSPWPRAKQTAEIINSHIKKPLEISDLFRERRKPSAIVGRSKDEPDVKQIMDFIDKGFHEDNVRYSDEENFLDLKNRSREALEFLEKRPEKKILVVTHGFFMTILISYMVSREKLDSHELVKRYYHNDIRNTGVTYCEWWPRERHSATHGWRVIAWNDEPLVQAHMAGDYEYLRREALYDSLSNILSLLSYVVASALFAFALWRVLEEDYSRAGIDMGVGLFVLFVYMLSRHSTRVAKLFLLDVILAAVALLMLQILTFVPDLVSTF